MEKDRILMPEFRLRLPCTSTVQGLPAGRKCAIFNLESEIHNLKLNKRRWYATTYR